MPAARLVLRAPEPEDLPEVFALYSDPRVWGPDPLSRHDDIDQTERMIENWRRAWQRDGLGMWIVRSAEPVQDNDFVGVGGCFVRYGVAWNLGFRLDPRWWGQGHAQEISAAAIAQARVLRPDLPVTAYVLDGNDRSRRAVERLGLTHVWRGPDAGNPDPAAIRLLFSDRPLSSRVQDALTER
ncbi:GNAT family N-acetyltransferase [Allokutzneria albata]|uniref:Protein N-acetyltransferase, RimJ/RimL family n=1 Tax=Allokutzneria albata TaxID=211114 RepID=A0A1G9SIE6_ALLAB|nr:GNAT family N-acetyltransferase [Allokutzneria albata]SDM35172.1 Protein N-acetyltransferase, RimJ/RimL family [Allokutzneria albata]